MMNDKPVVPLTTPPNAQAVVPLTTPPNAQAVVPLTTPPTKKMNIGIKILFVFLASAVMFFLCLFIDVIFSHIGYKLVGLICSFLGVFGPILIIILGIPLVLILHYAKK